MMAQFIYVDNSNVFIEAKRVSAVKKGLANDIYEAMNYKILDNDYRLDFGKLHNYLSGTETVKKAVLFGSRPPENDSIWYEIRKAGFETIIEDRNYLNKEKKIDTGIVAAMIKDAYTICDKEKDVITLVAGDADFIPAISMLINDGFNVKLAFWGHASQEFRDLVNNYINLDSLLSEFKHD
jgi:uncharacterized LabA/DUF88 family protein